MNKIPLALTKIEDYGYNFIKVIKQRLYDLEILISITETGIRPLCYSLTQQNTLSKKNLCGYCSNYWRRDKAEIDGRATANLGSIDYFYRTSTTFHLKTLKQKNNFWGNLDYHSDYNPSYSIEGHTLSDKMSHMPTFSGYTAEFNTEITSG